MAEHLPEGVTIQMLADMKMNGADLAAHLREELIHLTYAQRVAIVGQVQSLRDTQVLGNHDVIEQLARLSVTLKEQAEVLGRVESEVREVKVQNSGISHTIANFALVKQTTKHWIEKLECAPVDNNVFAHDFEFVDLKSIKSCWKKALEVVVASAYHTNNNGKEDQVQELTTAVHQAVLLELKEMTSLSLRDTHAEKYPVQPTQKIDNSFVPSGSSSANANTQVSWFELCAVEELKKDFKTNSFRDPNDGLYVQIVDRTLEMFKKQSERKVAFPFVGCGGKIQFFRFTRQYEVLKSAQLDFLVNQEDPSEGFVLYIRLLCTSLLRLGYCLSSKLVPTGVMAELECTDPVLVRNGGSSKADLFSVKRHGKQCCLKLYKSSQAYDTEVAVLEKFAEMDASVPTLLARSAEQKAIVVFPLATSNFELSDFSCNLFVEACHSLVPVLNYFDEWKLAYVDPSPSNILVSADDNVLWNDFADTSELNKPLFAFCGTVPYSSLRLNPLILHEPYDRPYERLDDLQALFFTLLSFCLKRGLPWKNANVVDNLLRWKFSSMMNELEWSKMEASLTDEKLKTFFAELRRLLFLEDFTDDAYTRVKQALSSFEMQ